MELILKDKDTITLSIAGVNYTVKADGRVCNGEITVKLEDIFADLSEVKAVPAVDYSKIPISLFIYESNSRAYFANNKVFNLQEFIDLNEKTLLETNYEKDIFNDMIIKDANNDICKMCHMSVGRGISSYDFLYCIANIYILTGEMLINISANRNRSYTFDLSSATQNLLKTANLSEDDINKRYYKYYKKAG